MNHNFKLINKHLSNVVSEFEQQNGDLTDYVLNENDEFLHSMKVKGDLFKTIDLDSEFEQVDLLDFLGYERVFACKKSKKK